MYTYMYVGLNRLAFYFKINESYIVSIHFER